MQLQQQYYKVKYVYQFFFLAPAQLEMAFSAHVRHCPLHFSAYVGTICVSFFVHYVPMLACTNYAQNVGLPSV